MVISLSFRDSHRRPWITCTNLFDLPCYCSLLVDYFFHCYGTSNVPVGGVISAKKVLSSTLFKIGSKYFLCTNHIS